MLTFVIVLLAIWLILGIVGLAIKGLFWLFVVAVVLFLATAIIGWIQRKANAAK